MSEAKRYAIEAVADVRWEEPSPSNKNGGRSIYWREIADMLRANPGRWALISEDAASVTVTAIKNGKIVAFRGGGFDACARNISPRTRRGKIYVRYVGETDE